MAYEKLLNEIYAVLSLKYLWTEYQPSFKKSESPDWINETMDLGLEVSQALFPNDGKESSFIEKYLGCLKDELPEDAILFYGDRLHFYNQRFWAILPEKGIRQDYQLKAKYRFDKKLEKLNGKYQKCKYNGLYLYLHPDREDDIDPLPIFQYMKKKQATQKEQFDFVFLNCEDKIYICNYSVNKLETILLPQNAEEFLNTEAEYLRYVRTWEKGTEC